MAAGRCYILFVRENARLSKSLITMEVRFKDARNERISENNGIITQVYGFRDSYNDNLKIRDLIKEYASTMGYGIKAVIYTGLE